MKNDTMKLEDGAGCGDNTPITNDIPNNNARSRLQLSPQSCYYEYPPILPVDCGTTAQAVAAYSKTWEDAEQWYRDSLATCDCGTEGLLDDLYIYWGSDDAEWEYMLLKVCTDALYRERDMLEYPQLEHAEHASTGHRLPVPVPSEYGLTQAGVQEWAVQRKMQQIYEDMQDEWASFDTEYWFDYCLARYEALERGDIKAGPEERYLMMWVCATEYNDARAVEEDSAYQ